MFAAGAVLCSVDLVRTLGIIALAICAASGCGSAPAPAPLPIPATGAEPKGPLVVYDFRAVDGRSISNKSFAGRFTVIGFITTYDVASQAQARFLATVEHKHAPRVNVATLFLESADNEPLVTAFVSTLGIGYPVAMADADTIAGKGPFEGLHEVPSVVILDPAGHEVYRRRGLIDDKAIGAVLDDLQRSR